MTRCDSPDNEIIDTPDPVPTMVGESDLALIRQVASQLPKGATILEFGPWLGGITVELAPFGTCHVVDRFMWSPMNAKRMPGLFNEGESFRPEFERLMALHGVEAEVHDTPFRDFTWSGPAIDLVMIDAPRSGKELMDCLKPIATHLAPDCRILIKHGANGERFQFVAAIHRLLSDGFLEVEDVGQPEWCNTAVLKVTDKTPALAEYSWDPAALLEPPTEIDTPDPWGGALYPAAMYANAIDNGEWRAAYRMLDRQKPNRSLLDAWDKMERFLSGSGVSANAMAHFAAVLDVQNDVPRLPLRDVDPTQSFHAALRHAWIALDGNPNRADIFNVDALATAYLCGGFSVVRQLGPEIAGRDIALIGAELGSYGAAVIAAGARSFLGIEIVDRKAPDEQSRPDLIGPATIVPLKNSDIYLREHFDLIGVLDNFTMTIELDQKIEHIIELKSAKWEFVRVNVGKVLAPVLT